MTSIEERFFKKVEFIPFHTCWEWIGAKDRGGYGKFWNGVENENAHRISFEIHYKLSLKSGKAMQIDHLCKNPGCVNPHHLEYVTRKINILRSNSPSAVNSKKTHCIRGHEFTDVNTYIFKSKMRNCRQCIRDCKRDAQRKKRAKQKAMRMSNLLPKKVWPKKTHCIHGHIFDEKNTYIHNGKQCCRKCRNITQCRFQKNRRDAARGCAPRKWVRKSVDSV